MSQERSISSESIIDLRQSFYSLDLDQNSDQINLNGLNLNDSNESNSETNVQANSDMSFNQNQTVYFHPSFLQLNSSPQSNNQLSSTDVNSIEMTNLNIDSKTNDGRSEATNFTVKKSRETNSPHKTSFEWEMYCDRNRVLKELRANRKFIDLQLIADDGYSEYVHSTVISALGKGLANCIFALKDSSKTPCTTLDSDSLQNHMKQIRLQGISGPVLKVIVNCAYTGYIETDDKQVIWSILDLSERFSMTEVLKACLTFLIYQLNIDNCVKLLHLGIKFKHKLRTAAWNFIRLKFDRIVNECADYIHLSIDELIKLLEDDHLNTLSGEQIVWQGICRWILADLLTRTKYLNRLLEKLRFGRLPLEYLEEVIAREPLLHEIDNGLFNLNNGENINQSDPNDKPLPNKSNESAGKETVKSNEIHLKNSKENIVCPKSEANFSSLAKSSQENSQSLNFEDANTSKVLSLVKRMICMRKNRQNQYRVDNRDLLVDLNPYFVRPRVPAEVIFVIGGWQENMITTLIETYDVRTNMWLESHISLEYTRAYHGLEVLNGLLYIIGGTNGNKTLSSMHCFNPNNGKWYERANMYERRCYVNTTILNDIIYAMGGHNGAQRLNSVEKYDYKTNQWLQSSPMNLARSDASAATYNNRIYIAGGLNEHVQNTVEFYDPLDNTWTFIQPMQYQRNSLSLVLYAGFLFALGGTNGSSRLNTVERYDFITKTWTLSKPMRCCRSTFSACVLEDKVYVVGGHDQHSQIKSVEYYDIQTDQWYEAKNLKRSRSGFNLCCYRSFTVSSKFTFNYYTEQQMIKSKKNVLKRKESVKTTIEPLAAHMNSSRISRKDLPTISMGRFRRRRNQFRMNSIYTTNRQNNRLPNPLPILPSIERTSTELVSPQAVAQEINYSINRQNSITPSNLTQTQDIVINIEPTTTDAVTTPSTSGANNISNTAETDDQTIHLSSDQQDQSASQIHSQQNSSTNRIYPSTAGLSTSGLAISNSAIQNDLSSTSSSDLQSPTFRIFETRSLDNERVVDQEEFNRETV